MLLEDAKAEVTNWKLKFPYASDEFPLDAFLVVLHGPQEVTTPKLRPAEQRVKRYDPETSWEAAVGISPGHADSLYNDIYVALTRSIDGLTNEQLEDFLISNNKYYTRSGIRSRRHELAEAGWVYATGKKRPTKSGASALVWAARREFDE